MFGPDYHVFLAPEERQRSFSSEAERKRFIGGRLLLRCLLSQKSRNPVHPSLWKLGIGAHGKPYLTGPPFAKDSLTFSKINSQCKPVFPQFNLSHSGDYIALAFSECANLGVDIELPKKNRNFKGIAQLIFTPDETRKLQEQQKREEAQEYFYRLWCRYEAQGKLEGRGLLQKPPNSSKTKRLEDSHFFAEGSLCSADRLYFWALCWRIIAT